jgi:hypothetical protein
MTRTMVGLLAGMALGFAGYFGGFGAFVTVAALGAVGFVVGRLIDGGMDVEDLREFGRRRR